MVGVPTSNRCDNCRIRKKKCGEQRPSCAECIRSGWNCPGYKSRWKFMDETARISKSYAKKKYVYDTAGPELGLTAASSNVLLAGEILPESFTLACCTSFPDAPPSTTLQINHFTGTSPLATALVYSLGCKVKGDLMPLWLYGSFFQFIPARLGHNVALDDAVSCISGIYCDKSSLHNKSKSLVNYENYVRALRSLQSCLNDEVLSLQSETLCASILLQICELAVNADKGKWGDLSRGSAQLIQARGVDKYVDPFDHSMLESQLSYIVVQAIKSGKDCYLRQPEWRSLLATTSPWPDDVIYRKEITSLRLRVELCDHLQEIPSLLADLYTLQGRQEGAPSRIELMGRALEAYDNMVSWLHGCFDPHCAIDFSETSPKSFRYPDIIAGVVDCVANTALLTLDKMICFLYHGNLPSSRTASLHHGDSEEQRTIQKWHQRAVCAFEYVRGESTIAAKPLEFGLRQFQSPNAICDNDDG
ncbi:C6 zinc finger domain protein [Rutstroemia sp. NJR-2017a WRK4]|nr:C6 zinc finger domain protein [Rutstroemia sp. NJR-2017a WRK4]